jgi:hypothetical protein
MIAKELITKLRAHRGVVLIETQNFDDVFWVQAVKSDLIRLLKEFDPDRETGFVLDKGYFGRDHENSY